MFTWTSSGVAGFQIYNGCLVPAPLFIPYAATHRTACLALFDSNCPEYFAPNERAEYAGFLDACPDGYHVATADGDIVGAFGVVDAGVAGRRRLKWIVLGQSAQGRGTGTSMMRHAISSAQAAEVGVIEIAASHRSAPFFARFGAREVMRTEDGWGPGMHRVDMELRTSHTLLRTPGGSLMLPTSLMVDRGDGGHLVVDPPRDVWERSELYASELAAWSFLVAAAGRAMLDALPQLAGGCINYWEAGNWSLNDDAEPAGRKDPRKHRRVHLHLLGRSPAARHPDWQWGEAPRFPSFSDRQRWSAAFEPLTANECDAVVARTQELLDGYAS